MIRNIGKQIAGIYRSMVHALGGPATKKEKQNWVHVASWFPETRDENKFD